MDFAMREWLTVIVVLLIVGVLLDGLRRMRQSRQESIKMSLSMHKGTEKDELMEYGSELPNGGARVIGERDEEDARQLTQSVQGSFAQTRTPSLKNKIPEQVSLNLEEEVPMLMEAVEGGAEAVSKPREIERAEPVLDETVDDFLEELVASGAEDSIADDRMDPLMEELSVAAESAEAVAEFEEETPVVASEAQTAPLQESQTQETQKEAQQEVHQEDAPPAEEVLIINVMAPEGTRLNGAALLDCVLESGMRFGEMQIFHRHVGDDGEGPIMFSMVNMVVPGTFDLNTMQSFETPGVSLFLSLPINTNALDAFNCMAATAQALVEKLGGELKDENRSVMTAQTLEHCRERIREYERKKLT